MTPAIALLKKHNIQHKVHDYLHDREASSYGAEAAQKLNVEPARVFKTLVVSCDDLLAVCVVPVSTQLDLKQAARALKVKRCQMADAKRVERTTGYVLGGVSPLGQKKPLKTLIDNSARCYETVFISAGKRGLEIELSAEALCSLVRADFAAIGRKAAETDTSG